MNYDPLFLVAQTLGAFAFVSGLFAMWTRDDRALLSWMLTCNTLFMIHYVLLGAYIAACMIGLVLVRLLLARFHPKTYWLFLLSGIAIGQFVMMGEPIDIFVLMSTLLGNVAYFRLKGIPLRFAMITMQLLWLPIAIYTSSVFALVFNVISMVVTMLGIIRLWREGRAEAFTSA
jgi:uncharacterized membrane protein